MISLKKFKNYLKNLRIREFLLNKKKKRELKEKYL